LFRLGHEGKVDAFSNGEVDNREERLVGVSEGAGFIDGTNRSAVGA
jgi:hypothetical protein